MQQAIPQQPRQLSSSMKQPVPPSSSDISTNAAAEEVWHNHSRTKINKKLERPQVQPCDPIFAKYRYIY